MDLGRLHEILASYGADPARWPAAEREAAAALLARSPEARGAEVDAAALDAVLGRALAEPPSAALAARVLAAARPLAATARARRHRRLVAAVAPLAAAAGLAAWLLRSPERAQTRLAGVPLETLDAYETPTDTLLSYPALDVIDSDPSLGCADPWADCDPAATSSPHQSRARATRRIRV